MPTLAELERCRSIARSLVERERCSIMVLAAELLRHRDLTANEVGALLSAGAGTTPIGAPCWV